MPHRSRRLAGETYDPVYSWYEAIGLVTAVGSGVTMVKEGDRVGVPWFYSACGHCEYCLTGWETVCAQAQFGGYTRNGGFTEYLLADPNYVAHIPTASRLSMPRR
jgi:propanol-preferring alcohol dehydrogenase